MITKLGGPLQTPSPFSKSAIIGNISATRNQPDEPEFTDKEISTRKDTSHM